MKSVLAILALISTLASGSIIPGIIPGVVPGIVPGVVPGVALQGPSAVSTAVGPDGSAIVAKSVGGTVVAPGAVVAPSVIAAAPRTVIAGPSGTVVSDGVVTTSLVPGVLGTKVISPLGLWGGKIIL